MGIDLKLPRVERSPQGAGFDLRAITGLLRRQARLIIATVLTIVALAIVATLAVDPRYTATSLIFVDPSDKNLLDPTAGAASSGSDSPRVDSEVEILRSDAVLMAVIASQNLVADPEFGVRLGWREKLKGFLRIGRVELPTGQEALGVVRSRLSKALSVQRRGDTYLISVQVTTRSPEKSAALANAISDAYIQLQIQSKVDSTQAAQAAVQRQIEKTRAAVVAAEQEFTTYISSNIDKLAALPGGAALAQKRDALNSLTERSQQASSQAEALQSSIQQRNWNALSKQLENDAAAELLRQREVLAASLNQTASGSPQETSLKAKLSEVEASLVSTAETEIGQLQNTVAASQGQLTETRQELTAAVTKASLPPDILAQIYELQQDSRNTTANYQSLLARLQNLETQSTLQVADSRIVSSALIPTAASFPRIPLILTLATVLALAGGVLLAFLFENHVGGFTSEEQVEAVTGLSTVTSVPALPGSGRGAAMTDQFVEKPLSRFAESIRRIRAMLDRLMPAKDETSHPTGKVLLVASALPNEGKTTIALSLARAYAQAGQNVLLVDCDLRKPTVHRYLKTEASSGLIDYLSGKIPADRLADITTQDSATSLLALVGTRGATIPTDELLSTKIFAKLIASARKQFDVVVLDSPPLEILVDGSYLVDFADAVAFVVKWAHTPQRAVLNGLHKLSFGRSLNKPTLIVMSQERRGESHGESAYYSDY